MTSKEIIILVIVSFSSLFVLGYSVHMFIGGLVSESTERWAIGIACTIGVVVIGFITFDIMRHRRRR
jgi:Mn2+/Fe2+ NRAMP family transporter